MYLDILSAASYGRYNIKLAQLTDLKTACYWSCLLDIIARVVKKSKFDNEGYFTLDRKYVQQQTSLDSQEQIKCDIVLEKLQVLCRHADDNNKVRVSLETMTSILIDSDVRELKKVSASTKKTRADNTEGKRAGIISRLQSSLTETDEELRTLYCQWIDVCYDKGICKVPQVQMFVKAVSAYSADIEVQKQIVTKAINLGYRDAQWAIEIYEKQEKQKKTQPQISEQAIVQALDVQYEF